jgi:3-methyladenine DNA glycosylase/8-oxoguanine DNA glycosylase
MRPASTLAAMVRAELRPRGPYSLRLSAVLAGDACRSVAGGVVTATVRCGEQLERVSAAQRSDGLVVVRAASDAGVDRMRFMLGLDDDHGEFLRTFARDPLLGPATRRLAGLRPLRTGTVAHALLRAVSGQLIEAGRARRIEAAVVRATAPQLRGLYAAPTATELARLSPAALGRLGLGARRAATLVRLCRSGELERLEGHPTHAVARRLERERGLGPWSAGVICIQGLGRFECGLARDLGLARLAGRLWGRRVEPEETDALLEPYGDWAGLASVYLLAADSRGLIPIPRAAAA